MPRFEAFARSLLALRKTECFVQTDVKLLFLSSRANTLICTPGKRRSAELRAEPTSE
jgi:hypothetical protein